MVLTIIKKELKRVFSDRRLIISTFLLPAISIYIIYSLMGSMAGNMVEDIKEHRSVIYVQNAPDSFKTFIASVEGEMNADITLAEFIHDDVIESLKDKEVDLFVVFGDGFDQQVLDYDSGVGLPDIHTFYNPAEEYSSAARSYFIGSVLNGYNGYEDFLLQERFGDVRFTEAFSVDFTNDQISVVDDDVVATSFVSMMLPMLIGIMLFAGAMSIGLDTIAGEKERGTMATLLLTPVKREHIALGKVIGLGIISIMSSLAYFVSILLSLPKLAEIGGDGSGGGMSLEALGLTPFSLIQLIVLMFTLVGIYVGLIAFISVRARTMKEAGTYTAPIYMIVMMAAFGTMFSQGGAKLYSFFIPVYGNITALKELFAGELQMNEFLLASGVALAVTGILVALITRAFNNEKVMFNT